MSVYQDQQIYDNFLSQALSRASEYENIGENYSNQLQQSQINSMENKTLGSELLFTTLPGIVPEFGRVVQSVSKIYKTYEDIKSRSSSIIEGIKTLPDDLKKLAGSKIEELNKLVKEGTKESLDKANKIYTDIQSKAVELKGQGEELIKTVKTGASDIIEKTKSSVELAKSNVSDIITNVQGDLTKITPDSIINVVSSSYKLPSELSTKESLLSNFSTFKETAKQTLQKLSDETDNKISELQNKLETATESEKVNINKSIQDLKDNYNNIGESVKNKLDEVKKNTSDRYNEIKTQVEPSEPSIKIVAPKLYENIPVSKIGVTAPTEYLDRYKEALSRADKISSQLKQEIDPVTKESLENQLRDAKIDINTSSRLIDLNTPKLEIPKLNLSSESIIGKSKLSISKISTVSEESTLSKLGSGISSGIGGILDVGAISGGILGTVEEAKGGMQSISQKIQTGIGQEQALSIATQRGAQVIQAGKQALGESQQAIEKVGTELQSQVEQKTGQIMEAGQKVFGETEKSVMQSSSQAENEASMLAKNTQNALETSKTAVSELAENVGAKSSDLLGSIAEKGTLEALGEITGLSAIPVVGEVVGLAGLVWGAVTGIEDLFSHHSSTPAPTPVYAQQASLVHQAGI